MNEKILFQCLECPAGYFGDNCTDICLSSYYGRYCVQKCKCIPCHHIYGCVFSTLKHVAGQQLLIHVKKNKSIIFPQNVEISTEKYGQKKAFSLIVNLLSAKEEVQAIKLLQLLKKLYRFPLQSNKKMKGYFPKISSFLFSFTDFICTATYSMLKYNDLLTLFLSFCRIKVLNYKIIPVIGIKRFLVKIIYMHKI